MRVDTSLVLKSSLAATLVAGMTGLAPPTSLVLLLTGGEETLLVTGEAIDDTETGATGASLGFLARGPSLSAPPPSKAPPSEFIDMMAEVGEEEFCLWLRS